MRASVRVYRTLLAVYPSDHRLAYSDPMVQLFADRLRRDGGGFGTVEVWAHSLYDLAVSASKERMETIMTNNHPLEKWRTFALGLLAANCFVVGFAIAAEGHPSFAFGLGFIPGVVLLTGLFNRTRTVTFLVVAAALVAAAAWIVSAYWKPLDWWMMYPIVLAAPVIFAELSGQRTHQSPETASA